MTARNASRLLRYGSQLVAGLAVGVALGLAASAARADDTVASLMRDPRRLDAVQLGCKTNQPWATDAVCRTAAEAIRRRFRGQGVPYTPHRVDPFPSRADGEGSARTKARGASPSIDAARQLHPVTRVR